MALPSLKGIGVTQIQEPDFNKALDVGHAPYSSMVPRQLVNTVFEMESSSGKNRANEKVDLGKYGWLTGHTTTGSAQNTINNLKKNPKLDYKVKNTPGWEDISTPEAAFGHTSSALAMAIRDNPGMSLEDIYFKKYVTAKQSDTPARREQFRKLMGTTTLPVTPQPIQQTASVADVVPQKKGLWQTIMDKNSDFVNAIGEGASKIAPGIRAAIDSVVTGSIEPEKEFLKNQVNNFSMKDMVYKDDKTGEMKIDPDKFKQTVNFVGSFAGGGFKNAMTKGVEQKAVLSTVEQADGAVARLNEALTSAKPARAELEAAYTLERSKRAAKLAELQASGLEGKAGYEEQLGALKGELASAEQKSFQMDNPMIEEDINLLFKKVKTDPGLDVFEKLNAQTALTKVLDGKIPTNSELTLLERSFGSELVSNVLKHRTTGEKVLDGLGQMVNLPRSIMSTFDLSAPFRQGIALISHPKAFGNAFVSMFKQFGSDKAFKAVQDSIVKMPNYNLMKQGKLALTDMGTQLSNREEKFMSNWAEKIPLLKYPIKASNRAYVGFLNKLRADVFSQIVEGARAGGHKLDDKMVEGIADFVNTASGRGSKILGVPIGQAGNILNGIFFSPRLMASRLTLLNPVSYVTANPVVRKEMFKSLFTVLGAGSTVLGLAKLAGAEVGTERNSSDFGKIKIGNTRIDIWGGFQQYVRMASQLQSGKYVSSTTGKEITLGEGYKPLSRYDIALRQIEAKEAPVLSFITTLLKQQDFEGKPVNVTKEVAERFIPMVLGDLYDLSKTNPEMMPVGLLGAFGFGTQTYTPKNKSGGGNKASPLKQKSGDMKGLKGIGL